MSTHRRQRSYDHRLVRLVQATGDMANARRSARQARLETNRGVACSVCA